MAETEEPADPPEPVDKEAVDPGEEAFDPSEMTAYSSADFHNVVQKHVLNVLYETMIETKLDWKMVAPFLEAARDLCRADFEESAEIRLHTVKAAGDGWVEAEEAYLGISVADRDDGHEWLSETLWLSDIAKAEDDPAQVRDIIRALERTIWRLNVWLAEKEGGAAGATPPEVSGDGEA